MIKIRSYKSQHGSTKHFHIVEPETPFHKSYASLLCLNNSLKQQDVDFLNESAIKEKYHYKQRIEFSRKHLKSVLRETGSLCCVYCQKNNLIIEDEGMYVKSHVKATIDHIIPVSKGGEVFSTKNVVVSCEKCNQLKDDLTLQDFLKRFAHRLKPNYEILQHFLYEESHNLVEKLSLLS